MRFYVLFISIAFLIAFSCDTQQQDANGGESPPDTLKSKPSKTDTAYWDIYQNDKYKFSIKHPDFYKVEVVNKAFPLISMYNPSEKVSGHPDLHADASISFINIYPKGLGTELPFGKRVSIKEYDAEIPADFSVDPIESKIFMLEDGDPWGYFLKPSAPPERWNENGFIFVQMAIKDYRSECIDEESKEVKPMEGCDPMMGDKIKKFGSVNDEQRQIVRNILQSLYFTGEKKKERKPITDLIRIEQPERNASVESPLRVEGKARGYWFFEASFPVVLIDKNDKRLASGIAEAKGEWMTEDFVPFEVELNFDTPEAQRGYLIFKKANPSGKPENDRSFQMPVIFE
ncbi:MAG: Gmad2 immunoglobulin-like domain-containing protein [Candidatus Cyclobacteriaceae bacterium M2_1C_046]